MLTCDIMFKRLRQFSNLLLTKHSHNKFLLFSFFQTNSPTMLFWWLTMCLSCSPLSSILSRIILCVAVTKPSDNTTNFDFIDDVTGTMTSQPLEDVDDLTTTSKKVPSMVSGVYDYESSINFDRYLKVRKDDIHSIEQFSIELVYLITSLD